MKRPTALAALLGQSALIIALTPALSPAFAEDFEWLRFQPPAMALTDQRSDSQDLQEVFDAGPVVLTFAYTTCESICPLGNAVMADLDASLPAGVSLITVTIDPATDTPARMARAAQDFAASGRWLWLTGADRDIRDLLAAVQAPAGPIELHDPIFVVWDPAKRGILRSVALPEPSEIAALLPR